MNSWFKIGYLPDPKGSQALGVGQAFAAMGDSVSKLGAIGNADREREDKLKKQKADEDYQNAVFAWRKQDALDDRNFRAGESEKDREYGKEMAKMANQNARDLAAIKYGYDMALQRVRTAGNLEYAKIAYGSGGKSAKGGEAGEDSTQAVYTLAETLGLGAVDPKTLRAKVDDEQANFFKKAGLEKLLVKSSNGGYEVDFMRDRRIQKQLFNYINTKTDKTTTVDIRR